jgi:hypothetical protein
MISTKSSRTNVGSKCLSTSALITVGDLEVSITFWIDVVASSCSIGHLDSTNPPPPGCADSGPNVGVRVDAYGLNWSRGVGGRCGARVSAVVRSAGRQRRFVWLGVLGVTSWAAVLSSIKPVVASMNVITRGSGSPGRSVARLLHVGVLRCDTSCWPRCCRRSDFEGRGSLRHRVPAARRAVRETKSRTPCRHARMTDPRPGTVFDIELVEETGCCRADSVTGWIS